MLGEVVCAAFHCIYSPWSPLDMPGYTQVEPSGSLFVFLLFLLFFWVQAVHSRQHTYLCLIYSQRCLPFDYENCDNLADYLSLQRADQAQTQDRIPTTQQRMSLLKFLAIVSTPSSFFLSTSLFSSLPLVFMSFTRGFKRASCL